MPEPTIPKEGEDSVKLSDTAREYLMYSDQTAIDENTLSPETIDRINKRAEALDKIKDHPDFEAVVSRIREKFFNSMDQLGISAGPESMSESWTYSNMAYIHDLANRENLDTIPGVRVGDPITDQEVQDQIASVRLGMEVFNNCSEFRSEVKGDAIEDTRVFKPNPLIDKLDKDHPSYTEIMDLLQSESYYLSDNETARLGSLVRQNLGEEGVSIPEIVDPEPVTYDEPDGHTDETGSKEKRRWFKRKKKGEEPEEKPVSVLGRMWRGEYVSKEEKSKARVVEKVALGTGKVAEGVASIFGAKTALRLADRWAKRNARMGEVRRIKEVVTEEKSLRRKLEKTKDEKEKERIQNRLNEMSLGASETEDTRIQKRIESIRLKITESKYLSPEKKAKLEDSLRQLEQKWITGEEAIQNETVGEIDTEIERHEENKAKKLDTFRRTIMGEISGELDQNVGEKAKRLDYAKEAISGVGVMSGAFLFRAGALGAIALGERYRKLKGTKEEGERVTLKELIVDGARDMALEMFGQGKVKDLKGRQKVAAVLGAWSKSVVPVMVAMAGASEVAERGAGTISKTAEHAVARFGEIKTAIESMSQGGDPGKALLLILNWNETLQRSTGGLYKHDIGYSPYVEHAPGVHEVQQINPAELHAQAPVVPSTPEPNMPEVSSVNQEGILTPEDKASLVRPEAEHSGALSAKELGGVSSSVSADNTVNPTPADTSATHMPGASDLQDKTSASEGMTQNTTVESDSVPKGMPPYAPDTSGSWVLDEQRIINLESSFGVSSADGITPEDVQKVAAQLQGVNSESADGLLKSWQEAHPEIAKSIEESRALVGLEKSLGVNSFEGQVSKEELQKVITELAGEKSADADKLLSAWEAKGLVDHDIVEAARFPVEHPSLEHAGFETTAAKNKIGISLELGKEGAPKYLEQVFYRMALDNADIGDEITNVEGARILNVGANMTALSEGHNVAGVTAEDFARHVSVVEGKIVISDYEGFHRDVLDKLTAHAEEIITPENVGNTGAVAYLDDIKNETWADMAKPEGADVNLDQAQIEQAEGHMFKSLVEGAGTENGLGENITDIHMVDQDSGTFNLAGETVTVDHGMITGIGDTHFDPLPMGSEAAHARLMEEAGKIEAHRLEDDSFGDPDDAKNPAQSSSAGVTGGSGDIEAGKNAPVDTNTGEATADGTSADTAEKAAAEAAKLQRMEELTRADQVKMLEKLGFGKGGQGEQEWEFLKNKPVEDLLNDNIEGHAGNSMDSLEGSHRGKLRKLIKLAIRNGEIADPSNGGPQKIGEALHQIIESRVTEQVNQDLHNATVILATPNLNAAEVAAAVESVEADIVPSSGSEIIEPIHTVENPSGSSVRFDYGADGKIVGAHPHMEDMRSQLTTVNDNYKELLAQKYAEEGTKLPMSSYEVVFENNVRQLEAMQQSLHTMEAAGNGSTPEAEFLRGNIERTTAQIEARFGDVLKDSGGSSSVEVDANTNNETPIVTQSEKPVETVSSSRLEDSPASAEPSPEIPASPQDVKLALENLVTGILANMDNVSPEVLKGLDGIGLDDIAKINDTTLLENIRDGAKGVIEEIKTNPPSGADPEVLSAVTRGNSAIIEVIDARLSKLKA